MPRSKSQAPTRTEELVFIINEQQMATLNKWKEAHNVIYGYCDESEYDYIFTSAENGYSIEVKNRLYDTSINLSDDDVSW